MAVLSYTFEKKLLLLSIAFVFVAGKGSIFYGGRDSWFLPISVPCATSKFIILPFYEFS